HSCRSDREVTVDVAADVPVVQAAQAVLDGPAGLLCGAGLVVERPELAALGVVGPSGVESPVGGVLVVELEVALGELVPGELPVPGGRRRPRLRLGVAPALTVCGKAEVQLRRVNAGVDVAGDDRIDAE